MTLLAGHVEKVHSALEFGGHMQMCTHVTCVLTLSIPGTVVR